MYRARGCGGPAKACGTARGTYRPTAFAACSGSWNWHGWPAESNATGQGRGILFRFVSSPPDERRVAFSASCPTEQEGGITAPIASVPRASISARRTIGPTTATPVQCPPRSSELVAGLVALRRNLAD